MRCAGIRLHKLALFGWGTAITAVLLLLALPVLAGILLILPVYNLIIYWKLLYNFITLSIGNIRYLNFYKSLRDYTSKCVYYRKYSDQKVLNDNLNKLPFASYLAGLIEGDGTIVVPKTLRSSKGKLNYPSIQIIFQSKDIPLALLIQKTLGFGSISKKKGWNAYVFSINNYDGLILTINLINGNMRTPKINSLYELIDFYQDKINIEKKPLNRNSLLSSPWLSGFIEADASFQIRTTLAGKYPKFECKLEICQRQKDHKGFNNLEFLKDIAEFFFTEVKEIRLNNPKPEYRVRTTNLKGNLQVKEYLMKYPLFGSKHLDSLDWMKVVDLFVDSNHKTDKGKEIIIDIKSRMNSKRIEFTWNHLQNFYNLNI
jgi:hypothetical protein